VTLIDLFAVFTNYLYGKSIEGRLRTVVGYTVYKKHQPSSWRLPVQILTTDRVRIQKKEVSGTVAAERYAVRVVPVKIWRRTNNCAHDASGFVDISSLYTVEKSSIYCEMES